MSYSIEDLQRFGFQGFDLMKAWDKNQILGLHTKDIEGVYVIARHSISTPEFTQEIHHKPRPRVWSPAEAGQRWVEGVQTLYFGKGPLRRPDSRGYRKGLANRIEEFRAHGFGRGASHYGGKLVWQLKDSDDLLLGWKSLREEESDQVESGLILGFRHLLGHQPYANKIGRASCRERVF